jgi:hypothetical protein
MVSACGPSAGHDGHDQNRSSSEPDFIATCFGCKQQPSFVRNVLPQSSYIAPSIDVLQKKKKNGLG